MTNLTPQQILAIPMQDNDAKAKTIYQYLQAISRRVWIESEGFSGKRPFGNSGWEHDLYIALAKAGAIQSEYDEEIEEFTDYDTSTADILINQALDFLENADPLSIQLPPEPTEYWVARLIVESGHEDYGPALWGPFTEKEAKVRLIEKQRLLSKMTYKVLHIPT